MNTQTTDSNSNELTEIMAEEVKEASHLFESILEPIKNAIPTIILASICAVVGFVLIKLLMKFINHTLNRSEMDGIASGFLGSILKIVLYVLLAVIILSLLHVPMDSIVAVIVSGSMAVALALKDSLANVAGGFILSFAKPIKAGDFIEIDGSKGKVESVGILYTKIVTSDNITVYVPNGAASSSKIINYTDKEKRRIDLSFSIDYDNDIDKARKVILDAISVFPEIISEPEPIVQVGAHGDSAVQLLLWAWVSTDNYTKTYYAILENVKKGFDKEGISIPYPQLEIHHDSN